MPERTCYVQYLQDIGFQADFNFEDTAKGKTKKQANSELFLDDVVPNCGTSDGDEGDDGDDGTTKAKNTKSKGPVREHGRSRYYQSVKLCTSLAFRKLRARTPAQLEKLKHATLVLADVHELRMNGAKGKKHKIVYTDFGKEASFSIDTEISGVLRNHDARSNERYSFREAVARYRNKVQQLHKGHGAHHAALSILQGKCCRVIFMGQNVWT